MADECRVHGHRLRGVGRAAVAVPAHDHAGLDVIRFLADEWPVRAFARKVVDELRKLVELLVPDAGVDAIEDAQRHDRFDHGAVAAPLVDAGHGRVDDFTTLEH